MRTLLCVMMLALLAACNTVEGVGQDLNQAGKAISKTANQTKERISK